MTLQPWPTGETGSQSLGEICFHKEFASRLVKRWGKGERGVPSHQKSLASWGAGLLYLPVPAPARAVTADGKASCQRTVTVQFPDPHVSGLSVNEQRQRGLWHQEKHKET